ncbi:AGC family protein kinase [Trichomonas vaginalis G3]|uniref:non-specific serine/threonine protein kinase n=1 Tax=Trichomonas vaginalis (strain ATCC PRA-98 / G3) TaxID=412133 RepID=A2EX40_TRIV3|nr:protein serine/threonine kinase protein [Trichomonas vaginalis G3]EAY02760.1 AGC family protein kinase [Trichomonas vaginalis G3]KAI5500595.1 protein serine/threonine kinase protein [Trichomonas vaginalis G3]|eukprot:XP_001314983.1 AGC family protein kinase [Trichomonas vaginalis G3]
MTIPSSIQRNCTNSGWLRVQSETPNVWNRKYVTVCNKSLIISKDESTKSIEKVIQLTNEASFELLKGSATPRFQVNLGKNQKPIIFSATTTEEVSHWISLLRTVQDNGCDLTMDDFQIISVIGRGYYGKVMLVRRIDTDQLYAIKSIRKSRLAEMDSCSVLTEKNIMMKIHHPFIVNLCFAFQTDTKVYLGLEYAPGGELFYYMESNGTIPVDDARLYVAEIGLALAHLHKYGIIYRDLKPENILFDADGHIKLTDFGLSKELGVDGTAKTFCGTPDYLAPEVIPQEKYTTKIDEWALGVLTYEMILGRTPFCNDNKNEMFQEIVTLDPYFPEGMDPRIINFIMRLLTKDPKERPTFDDVKSDPFFEGVDWDAVYNREHSPSYIPEIKDRMCTNNFDPEFTTELAADSFVSPGIHAFGNIAGFSYVEPNFA